MTDYLKNESDDPTASLWRLRKRKEELEEKAKEHTLYLNNIASDLCSCEEQQRIVSDIDEFLDAIEQLEVEIAELETRQTNA
jgi:hypothetical protein